MFHRTPFSGLILSSVMLLLGLTLFLAGCGLQNAVRTTPLAPSPTLVLAPATTAPTVLGSLPTQNPTAQAALTVAVPPASPTRSQITGTLTPATPALTTAATTAATSTQTTAPTVAATTRPATPAPPPSALPSPTLPVVKVPTAPNAGAGQTRFKIFLIAIEDQGRAGKKIGCGDSVVAVERVIPATNGPLRAALNELLGVRTQYYGQSGLYNSLYQSSLSLQDVTLSAGVANVKLAGNFKLGGECDNPRVEAQLTETALQFSTVQRVVITVNGVPLAQALSLK